MITGVKVRRIEKGNLKGVAEATVAETIVIRNIKICSGKNGLFVSMPQHSFIVKGVKKYQDVVELKNPEVKENLRNTVLAEFEKLQANKPTDPGKGA
jgi:DNA-binding cell septation regulator SpoVG